MTDKKQLWEPIEIGVDCTLNLRLGPLNLLIHRGEQEWHMAYENDLPDESRFDLSVSPGSFPQSRNWTRWMVPESIDRIQLAPRLPDRPVIVRPEMPMCLMPRQSALFFVGIPVWLSVSFGTELSDAGEVPAMKLSNSWFGSVTGGELCYALKTTAKLRQSDLLFHPHRTVFPLEIRNASDEKLNFERLCLRVQYLNIYQGATRMWTGRGRVSYRGEEIWSRIVYAQKAPEFDEAGHLLGGAREPARRGVLLKTFDNLKHLADF